MKKRIILLGFFLFLSQQFVFSNISDEAFVHYPNFEYSSEDIKTMDFDTVYLVASSPTSESVGSLGAHAFILLSHGDDISNAIAINFYAYHERLSTLTKIAKGATTGLVGYIDIRPFANIAERYTIGQNRTLFVYKTNIDKKYIPTLIEKFYEFKQSDLLYQFFNYNCSSLLGNVFSSVLSVDNKEYTFPNLIMPGRLVYLFDKQGLLVDKKTISPPLVKLLHNDNLLTKEEILNRHTFFKVYGAETTVDSNFTPFIANFDNFKSETMFSEKVSKLYIGMDSLKLSFGLSVFDNQVYEQRQSAIELYEFKLLDGLFSIDNGFKVDKFTLIETGKYTKFNLIDFTPSTYFSIKLNTNNNNLDINAGYGLSIGTLHSLVAILPSVELNTASLLLTLKVRSIMSLYTNKAFILLNVDYPLYNKAPSTNESIDVKVGYRVNEEFSFEASYDVLKTNYNVYFKYNFYPLFF